MEGELFAALYQEVQALALRRRPRELYSDATILLVYSWAVLHDRPVSWACREANWPPGERGWAKPSPSRMSRRLRRAEIAGHLAALEARLRPAAPAPRVKTLDGKPLVVGGYTKDPDASRGWACGAKARGYKLFALADAYGLAAWEVHGLGVSELAVAPRLLAALDGGGYVLADALHDANALHDIAGLCNHQLVAPRKKPGTGLGHHPQSPARRRAIQLLEERPRGSFGPELYKRRTTIERAFGHLGNFGGGLGPLPHYVRRLRRVRRWVQAKIILNALRLRGLRLKQGLVA